MKLKTLVSVLALTLGVLSVGLNANANEQVTAEQSELSFDLDPTGLTEDELLQLDSEMEEFRNYGHRNGNRGPRVDRRDNHRGGDRFGRHDHTYPRPRPVPPRYPRPVPRPVPPRYPRPIPHPVPAPQPQAWVCTAFSVYNQWQNYYGMRSYSYVQASQTAIQQCQWATGTQCVIRTCNLTY